MLLFTLKMSDRKLETSDRKLTTSDHKHEASRVTAGGNGAGDRAAHPPPLGP